MRSYIVERGLDGEPFVREETVECDRDDADPGYDCLTLTREELLELPGGPRALERWHAHDDSAFEERTAVWVREGREADDRREAERAKRRDHLRAL